MTKKQSRLWTPISNAFDVYRRRILAEPDDIYEHIWRLIHIQEALVVTLGSILASRLMDLWQSAPEQKKDLNRLRVLVTGMSDPNDNADSINRPQESCLGGSIKAWIDLLQYFGRHETAPNCEFCRLLSNYLQDDSQGDLAFLDAWKRISPVPNTYSSKLPRVGRFDAINNLRNKFAHVPLPYSVLNELHWGLRQEVLSFLSPEYNYKNDKPLGDPFTKDFHKCLLGRIKLKGIFLSGSSEMGHVEEVENIATKVEPFSSSEDCIDWIVSPFMRVDKELKVSLLFRLLEDLNDSDLSSNVPGEYHRFAAEIEPVQKIEVREEEIKKWIPERIPLKDIIPEKSELLKKEIDQTSLEISCLQDEVEKTTPQELRSVAERSFVMRDFSSAAEAFERLSKCNDIRWYNDVAKSKHGAALWRAAEHSNLPDSDRANMIKKSITLLEEATKHRDPRYAARAYYEKSKALWHLWMQEKNKEQLKQAVNNAGEAAKLDYQQAYISWYERVSEEYELVE
jgi:hypothetical protein